MPKTKESNLLPPREFQDMASDDFYYGGTGQAQIDFFRSKTNNYDLIDNATKEQSEAFKKWARGYFMHGQQYDGWDNMNNYDKKLTQIYDEMLDKSVLSQGVVVARFSNAQLVLGKGNSLPSLESLQAMEGKTIISSGHMSTGVAREGLRIGQRGKNVQYKIHIPSGSKGAGMWIGDQKINNWEARQREFMVNRNTAFRVGKTTYDRMHRIYNVDLYYVGRMKHDYGTSGKLSGSLESYNRL